MRDKRANDRLPPSKKSNARAAAAIAVDLDGTLLNSQRMLSARNSAVILKAAELGWTVIISTARPVRTIKLALPATFHCFYWAACNGAWLLKDGRILQRREIPHEMANRLISLLASRQRHFAVEADDLFFTDCAVPPGFIGDFYPLAKLGHRDACKIIVKVASKDEARSVQEMLPENCVAVITDNGSLVQVSHAHGNKLAAVACALEQEGVALENTIAFGDDNNDISLLEAVGCGVAMGNGTAELKAVADHVGLTNDEDGVAEFLEEYMRKVKSG